MTNTVQMSAEAASSQSAGRMSRALAGLWPAVIVHSIVLVCAILAFKLPGATDYVGPDNDDGMRLVEVRDFLAGQGWFDLMQYRLGPGEGTLMHWSRLIDLPIAALIRFFGLFLSGEKAEAVALAVWPLSLVFPAMLAMGIAGRRVGGAAGMHVTLGISALAIFTGNRFAPGSIDHHNVQLALAALMTAMILDGRYRASSYAIAGLAAALAIAIGVETTPLVAGVCLAAAILWAWEGEAFARAAQAFGLALAVAISLFFFGTVPPRLYSMVTCDNLSLGYYSLAAIGGGLLLFSATFASRFSRPLRFAVLACVGFGVLGSAMVMAPQCLHNPLADLDPMLVEIWLKNVSEAQSILGFARADPFSVGAFYACGLFGIAVCLFRMLHRDRVQFHAILLLLLGICWTIALVQVRGAAFSNLLSALPLALLIIDVRRISNGDSENVAAAFVYIATVLMSVPAAWAVGGDFLATRMEEKGRDVAEQKKEISCYDRQALAPLADLPTGLVAAPLEMGVSILRFTGHRVLTAPYHRDQGGMLTEMHIGLAEPQEAEAFLRGANVAILVFCSEDLQTLELAKLKPEGLYAQLLQGRVPPYLQPLPSSGGAGVRFFRFGAK